MTDRHADPPPGALPVLAAADLQDHLLVATNDLDRLQRLLPDASDALLGTSTARTGDHAAAAPGRARHDARRRPARPGDDRTWRGAITALQFQDMASQLIAHTARRLRSCADRLARDAMATTTRTARPSSRRRRRDPTR